MSIEYQKQHHFEEIMSRAEIKPYIDSKGWIRLLSRENQQIKLDFKGMFTAKDFVQNLIIKDFGVSDNEKTMVTDESWFFQNVQFQPLIVSNLPSYPRLYLKSQIVNCNQVIANVFNGKTPTGTQWSQQYNQGYLKMNGTIKTYGNWNKFWQGCSQNPYVQIGTLSSLRSGGSVNHTGQFIHSGCNGYKFVYLFGLSFYRWFVLYVFDKGLVENSKSTLQGIIVFDLQIVVIQFY